MKSAFREAEGRSASLRVVCEAPRKLLVGACHRDDTPVLEKQRRRHVRRVWNRLEHGLLRQTGSSPGYEQTTRHKHSSRPGTQQRSQGRELRQRKTSASQCQMISCSSGASVSSPCRVMLAAPSRWHNLNRRGQVYGLRMDLSRFAGRSCQEVPCEIGSRLSGPAPALLRISLCSRVTGWATMSWGATRRQTSPKKPAHVAGLSEASSRTVQPNRCIARQTGSTPALSTSRRQRKEASRSPLACGSLP